MKRTLVIIALAIISTTLLAQGGGVAPLAKGKLQLNFGTGYNTSAFPVIYASLDIAVHKDITITPEVNFKMIDEFHFGTLAKADYHWNYLIGIPNTFDFYSGFRFGFDMNMHYKDNDNDNDEFKVHVDPDVKFQTGARWYFSDSWALNGEIAGGPGFECTIGMSVKF